VAGYVGARWMLHDRALEVLNSRIYNGQTPLVVGAFPAGASPFTWSGIVETDSAVEELPVSLGPGSAFDPDLARTHFKPEASPALESARNSALAREFLQFARFPKASVEKTSDGYRVELRDLRFATGLGRGGMVAIIELNPQAQVIHEELRLGTDRKR